MWVWQSQAPAGTSKFTGVTGCEALAKPVRTCMVAPAAIAPIRSSRRVSMGFLPGGISPNPDYVPGESGSAPCVERTGELRYSSRGPEREKRNVRRVRNRGRSHRNRGRRDSWGGSGDRERDRKSVV